MAVLLVTFPLLLAAQLNLSALKPIETIELPGETYHVQGIHTEGTTLWITSVDRAGKRGLLFEYDLEARRMKRSVELQEGLRFHPGGLSADGDSLWIPVAEYRPQSTTIIQKRSKKTLALESQFEASDHIGAVALTPDGLVGGNWDARNFYVWDKTGRMLRKVPNTTGNAYQDIKFAGGVLVGGGHLDRKTGAIDWLEWPSLRRLRRIEAGSTDRGVRYTNEGMTIRDGQLWLLPEDTPSRIFVFELPK